MFLVICVLYFVKCKILKILLGKKSWFGYKELGILKVIIGYGLEGIRKYNKNL